MPIFVAYRFPIFLNSSSHYKQKLQTIRVNFEKDAKGSDESVPEKPVDVEDVGNGDIEETLLRGTGNHVKFRMSNYLFIVIIP